MHLQVQHARLLAQVAGICLKKQADALAMNGDMGIVETVLLQIQQRYVFVSF